MYIKINNWIYKIIEETNYCLILSSLIIDDRLYLDYNTMKDTYNIRFDISEYKHFIDNNKGFQFSINKNYLIDTTFEYIDNIHNIFLLNNEIMHDYNNSIFNNNKEYLINQYYINQKMNILLNSNFKDNDKTHWNEEAIQFMISYIFHPITEASINPSNIKCILQDKDLLNLFQELEVYELENENLKFTEIPI
jgi:hypothetical protein